MQEGLLVPRVAGLPAAADRARLPPHRRHPSPRDTKDWTDLIGSAFTSASPWSPTPRPILSASSRTKTRTARSTFSIPTACARPTARSTTAPPTPSANWPPNTTTTVPEMDVTASSERPDQDGDGVRLSLSDAGYPGRVEFDARTTVLFDRSVHVHGTLHGNVQRGDHSRADHRNVTTPQPQVGPRPRRTTASNQRVDAMTGTPAGQDRGIHVAARHLTGTPRRATAAAPRSPVAPAGGRRSRPRSDASEAVEALRAASVAWPRTNCQQRRNGR